MVERRKKVFDTISGYEYFVNHYFPHYTRSSSKSKLHHYLFERLPAILQQEKGCLDAIAAPRGEAKSTLVSQLYTLYCLVTQQKKYCLIVMDSIDQAYPMLEAIKVELEFNQRLRIDFPEVAGQGRSGKQQRLLPTLIKRCKWQVRAKNCVVYATGHFVLIWWCWMILKMTNKSEVR